ncbi:MAG: phosphodiester glycosidase family protein [Chitinophagaceae bacterium]|nr:phosphodiester glycosidase family protein [Chitinophagaceae bacterium]
MTNKNKFLLLAGILLTITAVFIFSKKNKELKENQFITFTVDIKKQDLKFFWKNDSNKIFGSIQNLKDWLNKKNTTLLFAMNGGMFKQDRSPQGLFIQENSTITPLDTTSGNGNFYLKPNGVFYITTGNIPVICTTTGFVNNATIKYATQSGPMLVINGKIHPAFKEASANLNIRNGVGILPDGKIIFAMSKKEINFYSFASYFEQLGCKNALYLDGFVSRAYAPGQNWLQTDGDFGVIIGVIKNK